MKLEKFKDAAHLSEAVADHILQLLKEKPKATLVLTSGDTPKKAYQNRFR